MSRTESDEIAQFQPTVQTCVTSCTFLRVIRLRGHTLSFPVNLVVTSRLITFDGPKELVKFDGLGAD